MTDTDSLSLLLTILNRQATAFTVSSATLGHSVKQKFLNNLWQMAPLLLNTRWTQTPLFKPVYIQNLLTGVAG